MAEHFRSSHAPQVVSFRRDGASAGRDTPPRHGVNRTFSPAVLNAARANAVTLDTLTAMPGSGRGGRVTKKDVEKFIASRVVGWTTVSVDLDTTAAAARCHSERARFAALVGAPLTFTAVAAEAVAQTLREFPMFNASAAGGMVALEPRVHLGIMIPRQDSQELVVPIIQDADGLSLEGMARALGDAVVRARTFPPAAAHRGTFTLVDRGLCGVPAGDPIPPHVAILELGPIESRSAVDDDGQSVVRPMATLTLTFDRRAGEEADAFSFVGRLRARLEAAHPAVAGGLPPSRTASADLQPDEPRRTFR